MEPTPIFAALSVVGAGPGPGLAGGTAGGTVSGHGTGRSVADLVRELRAERATADTASSEVGTGGRARVGHVPGLLSFRPPV